MARLPLTRLVRPILLTALLLAAAWIAARAPLPAAHASVAPQPVRQGQLVGEGPNRAAIAVKFGDGQVESRCVQFTEDKIGSDTLLERSGLAPAISPDGRVCMIGSVGCFTDDCWCQCRNPMAA